MTDASSPSASTCGTGTREPARARSIRYSRSIWCAVGSSGRRLLAQDHPPDGRLDQERRIRLPALVLEHAEAAAESVEAVGEPRIERSDVEPVGFANLDEDGIVAIGLHSHPEFGRYAAGHLPARWTRATARVPGRGRKPLSPAAAVRIVSDVGFGPTSRRDPIAMGVTLAHPRQDDYAHARTRRRVLSEPGASPRQRPRGSSRSFRRHSTMRAPRPRKPAPRSRLHDRPGRRRPVHPRQLLRAVPPLRRGTGDAADRLPGARGWTSAGHRDLQPLQHPSRRRTQPPGRCRRGRDGHDDAALPWQLLRADDEGVYEHFAAARTSASPS